MIPVDDITGLKVLVTGSSSGIGAEAARTFAACGAHVAIHYRSNKAGAEALASEITAGGGTATTICGDFSQATGAEEAVNGAVEALGGLDCLVNNAGAIERTSVAAIDEEVVARVLDVNMLGILRAVRTAGPHLQQSGRASIINLGSIAGRNGGASSSGIYAAAKSAVHSLTRSLAKEMAEHGVRVNAIAPGVIETPFHEQTSKDFLETVRSGIPMQRLGTAKDCAWAFIFLASPTMSGYITGQIIDINGGQLMP